MKLKYFTLLTIVFTQGVFAQDEDSKLTIPSTPAFSVLNFEPSAVMRPTTNKDLSTDILNSFGKDGKLLMNLGMEVTPFWLQSHPTLYRDKYLNHDAHQAFIQSFSISAATVKDSTSGDDKLGVGFRFKLVDGSPVDELKEADNKLTKITDIMTDIGQARAVVGSLISTRQEAIDYIEQTMTSQGFARETISNFKNDANRIIANYTDSAADIKLFLEKLNENIEASEYRTALVKQIVDLTYKRKGFILEFAGASGYNTTANKNNFERGSLWVNASNYVSPDDLFTLTGRYMFQTTDTALTNLDFGLGYLRKTDKFNISLEGMFRWYRAEIPDLNSSNKPITRLEKDFTYRVAVESSYMLNKGISLNISLGKNFNSPFISRSGFFSIMGINYSLFDKKNVNLQDTKE